MYPGVAGGISGTSVSFPDSDLSEGLSPNLNAIPCRSIELSQTNDGCYSRGLLSGENVGHIRRNRRTDNPQVLGSSPRGGTTLVNPSFAARKTVCFADKRRPGCDCHPGRRAVCASAISSCRTSPKGSSCRLLNSPSPHCWHSSAPSWRSTPTAADTDARARVSTRRPGAHRRRDPLTCACDAHTHPGTVLRRVRAAPRSPKRAGPAPDGSTIVRPCRR